MGKRTVDLRSQKPLLDIVSHGRRAPGHGRTFTPAERDLIGRTVARVPEVMIKVTGGGKSVSAVWRHLRYIDRRGGLELEADDGERLQARGAEKALLEDWGLALQEREDRAVYSGLPGRRPVKLVHNLMFSMPKGTPPKKLLAAVRHFAHHRYMSSQHGDFRKDSPATEDYTESLRTEVTSLLYEQMRTFGVLSMAARWNCPLMWSHYADEHKGVCIEFDVTDHRCDHLSAVDYDTAGVIKVSDLFAWKVRGSVKAQQVIWNAFFYAKAKQWRYEREWRDVAKKAGAQDTPLKLNAIYFGLRCDYAVMVAVVKLFTLSSPEMRFFEIYRRDNSFQLKRRRLYTDEIEQCGLRSSTRWDFEVIDAQ